MIKLVYILNWLFLYYQFVVLVYDFFIVILKGNLLFLRYCEKLFNFLVVYRYVLERKFFVFLDVSYLFVFFKFLKISVL